MRSICTAAVAAMLLTGSPAWATETAVPEGVSIAGTADDPASEGEAEKKPEKKKPKKPAWQVEGATVGKAIVVVSAAAGTGWVSDKAYADNPLTEEKGDGPSAGKGTHEAGTAIRWLAGYVTPKGWLIAGWARLGLSRGSNEGFDDEWDAWLLGMRVGSIFYSKHNLDIFWFAGLGYGHMRHRVSDVPDPNAEPDDFTRRDLWLFDSRPGVDVWKKSGFIDVHVGALFIYHFTPIFNLVFEVTGDFLAPDIAFSIDVAAGLGIAFP